MPAISQRTKHCPSSSISQVSWVPARDLELPEWIAAGRRLGAMGRSSQWGLGDWIRYGNTKFGERYAMAARITGYDVQTLMNMVYVSSRFEVSRRRETLSWSHHETVASLEENEQNEWLDRASAEHLTISDLRQALRTRRRSHKKSIAHDSATDAPDVEKESSQIGLKCPRCGHHFTPDHTV
jgi:hypothetical protein